MLSHPGGWQGQRNLPECQRFAVHDKDQNAQLRDVELTRFYDQKTFCNNFLSKIRGFLQLSVLKGIGEK